MINEFDRKLSETNIRSITKKVSELTRAYVTQEVDEFFTREAQNLGLEHVRFRLPERDKVQLHKADFRDVRPKGTKLTEVLSGGRNRLRLVL